MKKRVSIHDIAEQLNVSATTVSFVLNGKAEERKISVRLQNMILEHVEKIGYRPNHIAQSLRTGKSMIIGMLVEDIADPFFSSIARVVEDSLYDYGYKIFHSSTDNKSSKAKELLQIFNERQVDGYIVVPSPGIENEIKSLLKESKPVVVFDRYFPSIPTCNVVIDNKGGAYNATKHLIDNGYRNIAFVTLNSDQVQMSDRKDGFHQAVDQAGLKSFLLQLNYKTSPAELTSAIKKFISSNNSIDAVLFGTNYLAVSGLKAIQELNLNIPQQIGMVGFDDNNHFSLFTPSITAVAQPVTEISKNVVKVLMEALSGESQMCKPQTIVLPTELIIRESSIKTKK
ncbi:MAG: substrate-binding domain-containing protein [Lacibacter sp.]